MTDFKSSTFLVTGCAGFIGFHLSNRLMQSGARVIGLDGLTDYYDVKLKKTRLQLLIDNHRPNFLYHQVMLEDRKQLSKLLGSLNFEYVVHLAAQAGVRYSLENPDAYVDSNFVGTFNLLNLIKDKQLKHLLFSSTSSVYGANSDIPFKENQSTLYPLSIYAATKIGAEALFHSYAYSFNIPTTVFRFFTVYGPWGRPDMALFKFVKAILQDDPIEVYNYGKMFRDFTYIDDLIESIIRLLSYPPSCGQAACPQDTLSPVAPYRVVNIGNSKMVSLEEFISAIEIALDRKAKKTNIPLQKGDVPATWADNELLFGLTSYRPSTQIVDGVKAFVDWYLNHYGESLVIRK